MEGDLDPTYTKICSAQTIQSDEKGFFAELFASVKNVTSQKWIQQVFHKKQGDFEKIQCVFGESNDICDILMGMLEHVAPVYKEKNATISAQRRQQAEQLFEAGEAKKSLILCSQAVLRAPEKGI